MTFNKIDINNWERKEIFHHFLNQQTSFSLTNDIDITELYQATKAKNYKFYPAFIFLVTKVVHSNRAFRMSLNCEGELGYWDQLEPLYTIFDKQSELFSAMSTNASGNFKSFYDRYVCDVNLYSGTGKLFPKTPIPENIVNISMIPWTSFTGFNLNVNSNSNYLLPIVTAGRFIRKNNSIYLPLSLQVHHAVCDGYHAGMFMNTIQTLASNPQGWLE